MRVWVGILAGAFVFLSVSQGDDEPQVALSVPAGAPLRLYLTKKVSKLAGAPVQGKILEPVFAFDKEVVPAGSVATSFVCWVQTVPLLV